MIHQNLKERGKNRMYEVLNDNNVFKQISDEDIEIAVKENNVTYMVMQAMGQSHREEYMQYVLPFLDGYFYERRAAIQSILNINGKLGLEAMKKKSEQYSLEDEDPWNKILLMVAIISAEEGAEGLKKYFLSEEGDFRVKDTILTFYDRGYQYKQSDIELVCFYIRAYINQSFGWIKKMKKSDWNDSITAAFGSILYAGADTNTLSELSDELSDEICDLCETAIEKRLGDSIYCIAIVSQHMRREYAVRILKALKDNVRGNAKKEFKKSLKKWNIDVEVL